MMEAFCLGLCVLDDYVAAVFEARKDNRGSQDLSWTSLTMLLHGLSLGGRRLVIGSVLSYHSCCCVIWYTLSSTRFAIVIENCSRFVIS